MDAWTKRQPPYVEIALATAAGSTQGAVLGGVMGAMTKLDPEGAGKLLVPPTGGSDAVRLSQRFWRCPTTVLARSKPVGGLKADHHSLRCGLKQQHRGQQHVHADTKTGSHMPDAGPLQISFRKDG